MRTVRFGRTNAQVSAVSLGTWAHGGPNQIGGRDVGWSGHDDDQAREALRAAWRAGIRHWDTADVYGNGHAEELIGSLWGEIARDDLFLATKVGWDRGRFDDYYHPEQVRQQLEGSLRRLAVETIDLFYLHHCDFGPGDQHLDDALAVLHAARDEGKIRFIGLSDWSSEAIMRVIARVDPDAVQPLRHVTADHWHSSGLAAWCAAHDVGAAFFSPIRHGLLLGKYPEPVRFPAGDFRSSDPGFADAALLERLVAARDRLAERFADRPEPVLNALLGALLQDAPSGCVLLGQRNPAQVQAATHAAAPLSAAEAAWVRALYADLS
jgi:aryl-alcohol dehydrogenase-like predicted oxidoreductase